MVEAEARLPEPVETARGLLTTAAFGSETPMMREVVAAYETLHGLALEVAQARRDRVSCPEVGLVLGDCMAGDFEDEGPCYREGRYRAGFRENPPAGSVLAGMKRPCPSCAERMHRHRAIVQAAARLRGAEQRLERFLLGRRPRREAGA